ncbi:MAG: polyribonucleotide nucleotidyltransferase [Pseudomonadota bacterium]
MFKIISKEIEWAGSKLKIETGKIARQSDGAVMVTYGDTMVLCTAVTSNEPKEGIDFLPLTVHYKEMYFASGKIPGGFLKRESKPSEKEVLISRLIDRPIRPTFPENYHHETQVICTVMSFDNIHDADIIAIIGTAAALAISRIPFEGPVAAAKVGYKNGEFILNPKLGSEITESELELVVAGTEDSVLMVESEAKILSEEIMLEAVKFGHQAMKPIIKMINELAVEANVAKIQLVPHDTTKVDENMIQISESALREAYKITDKQSRYEKIDETKKHVTAVMLDSGYNESDIQASFKRLQKHIVRRQIIELGQRIDGRTTKDIRNIECEVSFLPRAHGSALFTRGETQAIVGTTLGSGSDEQLIDALEGESKQNFMLHYNFPPYSVGETSPFRAPGRREIGHGKLAWRAIKPVLPTKSEFPYTLRVVSEITESNGSSSMATVCGATLSLMDAGVPIKSPVSGIAMGLILDSDKHVVLSDILGDEDHLGDMDFKVAGTEAGITALQMDIKIRGINYEIMKTALAQAKEGRMHILSKMSTAIDSPRESVNEFAPSIITLKVNKDKIRELIGPGGKMIKSICEASKAKVDIDDNGTVTIASLGLENGLKAQKMIEEIACDPEVNKTYFGKVVKLMEFGAFVNIMPNRDGFLHISEISNVKIAKITDVLQENDQIWVKVLGLDPKGKVKLSMRLADQDTGEALEDDRPPYQPSGDKPPRGNFRGDRSDRGDNRGDRGERGDRNRKPSSNFEKSSEGRPEKRKYFG